jgi:hypothetical protein
LLSTKEIRDSMKQFKNQYYCIKSAMIAEWK